jgi:hypothetical protein
MSTHVTTQLSAFTLSAQIFFPPIDPYVASAGYNMLVQVVYTRIVRYLNDTWMAELAPVSVSAAQLLSAAKSSTGASFTSSFLKNVQDGSISGGQIGINCQLSIISVNPGAAGQISIAVGARFSGYSFSVEGEGPYVTIKQTPLGDFGPLVLQMTANISADTDTVHAIATINADMAHASVYINAAESSADAMWLSGTSVGKTIVANIQNALASSGAIEVMPPLSPFGDLNGKNVFETFLVDVFPTNNPLNAAAGLSVGFRLRNAAVASPNEVQSIAGFDQYGTIMDEWTVARVLEQRWPQGYLQYFTYSGTTTVDLNDGNGPQDVEIWGSLNLNSLDSVTIAAGQSTNGEFDYIDLSGGCTVTIDKIKTLKDGKEQSLQNNNSYTSNWSFAAGVSPNPPAPTTPLPPSEKAFVDFTSQKTVKYIARPLRGVTQVVTTGTLDGVAGYLYATGHF